MLPGSQNLYMVNTPYEATHQWLRSTGLKAETEEFTETIDHLISGCTILAPNEYTNRHNRVGQYIHWKICNHYNIETPNKWYEHKLLPVVDTPKVTILWDFPVRTDRIIQANWPDIITKHKENKRCQLIDISVP